MTLNALIAVFGLAGLLLLIAAFRRFRVMNIGSGVLSGLSALVFFLLAAGALLLAANLRTYQRLTGEEPAGELDLSRVAPHIYQAVLTYPNGSVAVFSLRGDEWQVDAHILKWQGAVNLLGFDTAFRLDRISGRYTRIEDERSEPRTVYDLNPPESLDLWDLAHRFRRWLPWVDALYGSATFLPMADKASYEISVSTSGLLARPLNAAARDAVSGWH
ncbi:MAG TPA: hypothetical protein VME42_13415 [Steroidobacteraceae bacterium]|nr:hypothetical protein [Steroidobacteraceae bacterium]